MDRDDDSMHEQEVEELNRLSEEVEDDLPSRGLLSFYDRLRARIQGYVGKKGGTLAPHLVDLFLVIPDVFILLLRLALDKDVPKDSRRLVGGALAYFVLPFDLLPEAIVGPVGYTDDLLLAVAVLSHAFGRELEPYAAKYWSGSQSLRRTVGDALEAGHELLGTDLYGRLRKLLADKGVDLDAVKEEHVESVQ